MENTDRKNPKKIKDLEMNFKDCLSINLNVILNNSNQKQKENKDEQNGSNS